MVGGAYLPRNVRCMAEDGRLSLIAVQKGAKGELDLARMLMRRLMLTGSTLRARSAEFKTMVADELSRNVWTLIDSGRSEEHTSELQSLMRIPYAVFCLTKNTTTTQTYMARASL